MNKLRELTDALDDAKSKVEDAKDALYEYLSPIIKSLYNKDRLYGGIYTVETYTDSVYVTLRDDCRGGPYDTDYKIPKSVFKAQDALAEAAKIQQETEKEAMLRQRQSDLAHYEELKKKLGIEDGSN